MSHLRFAFASVCISLLPFALSGCGSGMQNAQQSAAPQPGPAPSVVALGTQVNGVAPNRSQFVQFNEAMDPASINGQTFTVADASGKAVPGKVTYDTGYDVAAFQPSPALQTNASYTLIVTTGAASAQGAHLAATYTHSFTTRSTTDTSPIYVAGVTPAPNATCVSATSPIVITFSEGADVSTINSNNLVVTGPDGKVIQADISYDVATAVATLTPAAVLPSGTITVTVQNVTDAAGVAMTSAYAWGFSTACGGGATGAEYLYVDAFNTQDFYAYSIDPATGNLSPVPGMPFQFSTGAPPIACRCYPIPLADPLGRFLFFDSDPNQGVGTMTVNSATGALTSDDFLAMPNSVPPQGISTDPQGRFIFGIVPSFSGPSSQIRSVIVASDGKLSLAPGEPFEFQGGLEDGTPAVSDQFVYVSNRNALSQPSYLYGFSLDQTTGALSAASKTDDGIQPGGQVITPSGKFLYSSQTYITAGGSYAEIVGYQVNSDGSLRLLSQVPQQTEDAAAAQLFMSPNGNFLYLLGSGAGREIRAYMIDQNTGALSLTAVYNIPFIGNADFAIDPAVKYVYVAEESGLYSPRTLAGFTVNPTTGALTPISGPQILYPAIPGFMAIVRPQ